MANEKNVEAAETATVKKAAAILSETPRLFVKRVPSVDKHGRLYKTRDGRQCYGYMLPVKVGERETKVDFAPSDKGGYEVIDYLFDMCDEVEVILGEAERTDSNGKVTTYDTYMFRGVTSDGKTVEFDVKPARKSDAGLLKMAITLGGV